MKILAPLPRARMLMTAILILTALAAALPAGAAWISLGGPEGARVGVNVRESSPDRIVLEYTIPGFDATPVVVDGRTWYRISVPHEGNRLEAGLPELPRIARSVIIPDDAHMSVRVLESDTQDFPSMPVIPSKGNLPRTIDPGTVPYRFDPSFYGGSGTFPSEAAGALGEPYILRDYRGLDVDPSAFRAHADDGRLTVARRIVVEIRSDGPDVVNVIRRAGPPSSVTAPFDEIYAGHFVNYGRDRYTPLLDRGRILVITYDGFRDAVNPYVLWKLQEGIPTEIVNVSTIGNTANQIKAFIQAYYGLHPDLASVLLVGDGGSYVASPQAVGGSSDPTYTCLLGGDRYPEIMVGRMSAENVSQVDTQVQRTIAYEKTPAAGGTWYAKGTGIGSDQGPGDNGEYDFQHENHIRNDLLGYDYSLVDQIYDPGATAAAVSVALNSGRSIVNYTGHGSATSWGTTGFSNSNVAQLQNDGMLPFIFSVACVNGQFEGQTCFAEAWMRSTRNGNPIGAIATYMSSINQYWNPPMRAQDWFTDFLTTDQRHTYGALCFNASCEMMAYYGASDGGDMFLTWHIFGDPSLLLRTKTPQAMTVQHEGTILIGQTDYVVTVPLVGNALCSLYANGVNYGAAYTNANGVATIVLNPPPTEPMTLNLTVTGYNRMPVIAPVQVLPPTGPYLTMSGYMADDVSGGDGDGLCDAGETADLLVTLHNVGVAGATGVTAEMTENDPYLSIAEGTGSQGFGDIPAGGYGTSQGAYRLSFAPETPDNYAATLQLTIHANEGGWSRPFSIPIGAPALVYASQQVDDSAPYGNGTGWIAAGEAVQVVLTLSNPGHANARNVAATLVADNPFVDIVTGSASCADVPAEGQGTLTPFVIRVRTDCPVPIALAFHADLTADFGFTGTVSFQVSAGGFLDDCEAARGWTIGAPDDNATTGIWVLADPNGTTYGTPPQQVQPEDDHTAAPGAQCYVTGNGSVGGTAGEADLDGGKTTIFSPVFDLGRVSGARVSYWVWYTNNLGNNPAQDYWTVQVTGDGSNWINLERTTASTNAWAERSFILQDYLPLTDHVQLRFIADDQSPNSLIEAAIDDFVLTVEEPVVDAPDVATNPVLELAIDRIFPNPATAAAEIRFRVPARGPVSLRIYDVAGRLVRILSDGPIDAGEHRISWDRRNAAGRDVGAGVYFVQMRAPGWSRVRQVTLVN